MSAPALYQTTVTHSRRTPVRHRFRTRSYLWLVDLAELPRLPAPLGPFARFDPVDHLDVHRILAENGIDLAGGRVLMLASARVLGYVFNPISVYWCYRADGSLAAQIAEVHNTYGGRHAYLLHPDERGRSLADKALYVSPFYPVDGSYELTISAPGERVSVTVTLRRDGDAPFVATMAGRRRPATTWILIGLLLRYPLAPLRTSLLIRYQGVKLWLSGLPVYPRPAPQAQAPESKAPARTR